MKNLEKLEKLLSEATPNQRYGYGDKDNPDLVTRGKDENGAHLYIGWREDEGDLICALRNSAPLLLEIVKAAKRYREFYGPRVGINADALDAAFKKLDEVDL